MILLFTMYVRIDKEVANVIETLQVIDQDFFSTKDTIFENYLLYRHFKRK